MYIGLGIFLLVVGAILNFAWTGDHSVAGLDLSMIGWICIIAGLLAIVLSLVMRGRNRPAGYASTRATTVDPSTGSRVEETRVDPD